MPKRPIDTEPDDVFAAVFGDAADRPFGADQTGVAADGAAEPGGGDLLDLETLDLPDEIDEALWAEADPEADGVDSGAGDPADERELLDLDALELPDEVDEALWAEADPEAGDESPGVAFDALPDDGDGQGDGDVIDLEGLDLPDEIDAAAWAAMDGEAEADAEAETGHEDEHRGAVFDAEAAEALRGKWMAMLDGGVIGFRLDLTDKAAMDADGLAFLAAFARELGAAGGALTVAASGQVLELLALCELQGRWPVALEDAGEARP